MLLSPNDGSPKLHQVHILPPFESISVHPPVPLILQNPPVDPNGLPPSFASAVRDPHMSETLPELLERLDLDSTDSLRKYTKKILHEMVDSCKVGIQGQSRDDVQIRLGLLDDLWRDGKISDMAKVKIGCLASALKNGDLKQADKLHLALMVDHIAELCPVYLPVSSKPPHLQHMVSQWMVAVKRIMNELKLLNSLSNLTIPKKLSMPSESTAKSLLTTETSVAVNGFSPDLTSVYVPEAWMPTSNCHAQQNSKTRQVVSKQTELQWLDKGVDESEKTS